MKYYEQLEYYSKLMRYAALDLDCVIFTSTQIENASLNHEMDHTLLLIN